MSKLMNLVTEEQGIQHAEEALLLALIAVALTTGAVALKDGIAGVFSRATTNMAPAA